MQILRPLRPQIVESEAPGAGTHSVWVTRLPDKRSSPRIVGPACAHVTGRWTGDSRCLWKADVAGRGRAEEGRNVGASLQGTECLRPLTPNSHGHLPVSSVLGGVRSRGWRPQEWDLCPYERDPHRTALPLSPCEDTTRRRPSMKQDADPRQTATLPVL